MKFIIHFLNKKKKKKKNNRYVLIVEPRTQLGLQLPMVFTYV